MHFLMIPVHPLYPMSIASASKYLSKTLCWTFENMGPIIKAVSDTMLPADQ